MMDRAEAIKELESYAEHSWGGLNEALEMAIAALREQEQGKWISVKERPPDEDGCYITMTNATGKTNGVLPQKYETNYVRGQKLRRWHWLGRLSPWIVTHWMPMPEPPKKGADE